MTASYDDMVNGFVVATCWVKFNGTERVAGRRRAYLDCDDVDRGRATGKSLERPDGAQHAAHLAAAWFQTVTQGRAFL